MANNQLLASDNFASGSLAAGWGTLFGLLKCQVVGTGPYRAEPNTLTTEAGQIWTGLTWPNDHASEITIATLAQENISEINLSVRFQSGSYSGYRVEIYNGEAVLRRFDNSSATLLSTVTGLTIAAGDIWCLQAAGACITLYQNYIPILFVHDTTYTSGFPGFSIYTSVALSHAQVASWRGYSAVQQDGIWQKQGVVIPAIASDLSSDGDGTQNPCIIFESSAKILSGNVYKMWFVSGSGSGTTALSYAESLDGKAWTRYSSNPVIASCGETVTVLKVGSTYYAYSTFPGPNVTLFTSTDGLAWVSQGTVFTQSASIGLAFFSPLAIVSGTWYATYINDAIAFPQQTRLATSPDGLVWTDYSGNPVVSNFWGMIKAFKVGSVWYAWGETTNPNAQETVFPATDPGEGLRMQTTDFIHWTNPVHSVHHSQQHESLNSPAGGCFPVFPINVNGKMYLYSTVTPNDLNTAPQKYQIGLAIAPAPIESIALQPEDAVQQIATDPFTSGSGNLSANWTTPTGGTALKIVAGPYVEPTATSVLCTAVYTGASFGANQYSEIVLQTLTGTFGDSEVAPTVRASVSAVTHYEGRILSPSGTLDAAATITKRVAGAATVLAAVSATPTVGDVWRLSVMDGSDGFPVLSLFQNGILVLQVQDQSGAAIETGNPGMAAYSLLAIADAQIASWTGGNANQLPNYPSPNSWLQPQRNFINKHCL